MHVYNVEKYIVCVATFYCHIWFCFCFLNLSLFHCVFFYLINHSWCQILNRAPGITIHTMKYGMKINVTQKYSPIWQMWKLVVLLILKETFSKHTVLAHVINDWFRPWAKVHKAVTSISIFCESWCFWYNQLISSIFFVKITVTYISVIFHFMMQRFIFQENCVSWW